MLGHSNDGIDGGGGIGGGGLGGGGMADDSSCGQESTPLTYNSHSGAPSPGLRIYSQANGGSSHLHAVPERKMTWFKLTFVAFVTVCGGPFGIEEAVQAAGAFPTIIGSAVLAVFWALPQALMTAELSTIFDVNGGYIVWVHQGLGRFPAFLNACNSVASNVLDLPVYAVLFAGYINNAWPSIDGFSLYLVKLGSLVLVVVLNIIGLECVAFSSIGFAIMVLLPFMVMPFLTTMKPENWTKSVDSIDFSVFASAILWNFQGWDSLGCIAGEVKDGKKTYPIGVSLAIALIAANYIVPVMVGASVEPDFDEWDDGFLVDVGKRIHHWVGYWVLGCASIAVLSEFNAIMATSSRALQSVSNHHMLPGFLSWNPKPFATPISAIAVQSVTTAFLMIFDFDVLVVLDTFFNNVSLILEVAAFLRLKYTRPNIARPYAVPGKLVGAWVASLPKLFIIGFTFYSVGWSTALIIGTATNILFVVAGLIWVRCTPPQPLRHAAGARDRSGSSQDGPTVVDDALLGASPGYADSAFVEPAFTPSSLGRRTWGGDDGSSETGVEFKSVPSTPSVPVSQDPAEHGAREPDPIRV